MTAITFYEFTHPDRTVPPDLRHLAATELGLTRTRAGWPVAPLVGAHVDRPRVQTETADARRAKPRAQRLGRQ